MSKISTVSFLDLRTLSRRILGIGHLLKHTDPDACASAAAFNGVGDLIESCGLALETCAGGQKLLTKNSDKLSQK